MTGVAQAWVLSLSEEITSDLDKLFKAFQERFASGPQDWLLSQKLSARKQQKGESLDDYIADITRLSRRLKLSEKESMRVLIEGLPPDLQCHVSLGRPKTNQESMARIKDVVNQRQGVSDSQAILTQMQTMFKDLMTSNNAKVVAATATAPPPSLPDKRVDELSKQTEEEITENQLPIEVAKVDNDIEIDPQLPNFNATLGEPESVSNNPNCSVVYTNSEIQIQNIGSERVNAVDIQIQQDPYSFGSEQNLSDSRHESLPLMDETILKQNLKCNQNMT